MKESVTVLQACIEDHLVDTSLTLEQLRRTWLVVSVLFASIERKCHW